MTEVEIQECIAGHERRNVELRNVMIARGVDLSAKRPIECHFWASKHRDGVELAKSLYDQGYSILILARHANTENELWNIEAEIKSSIEEALGFQFTSALVRLANFHSAKYDGWGTSI
jgi:regulator of RNase E activity RraB